MRHTARELSHRVMCPKKLRPPPSSPSASLCVSDPPAELALVNLVHAVLQYSGLQNYSSGGEGTCTVAATGGVCGNGLLFPALRSRIPGGNSKEDFKTIYRRDVCLQLLCHEVRQKAELACTADADPEDAGHWPNIYKYIYIHMYMYIFTYLYISIYIYIHI